MHSRSTPLLTGPSRPLSLLSALALLGLAPGARAATPASGSLDATHPSTGYSAGPFLVANVTATAGDPLCNALTPCDNYTLNVTVPAEYEATHSLAIKASWTNAAADFDLYVLNSAGAIVASSASNSVLEVALLPAVSGTYTVRVIPFLPLGSTFTGSAALQAVPVPPPPGTDPVPDYVNFAAPAGLSGADSAGEPSIGTNWKTGAVLYQSGLNMFRVGFNDTTTPATATWVDKSPANALVSLDPILFTDPATGHTVSSQLAGKTSLAAFSDDDGESWTLSMGAGINAGVDHQTIGGGPFAPGLTGLAIHPHAVYYCSQDIADASCAISRDGGLTFGLAVPMYSLLQCGGLHGHIKVAPDGTAYVPNKGCGANQAVVVSTDNGLTWAVRPVPSSLPADSDPSVGIASDGTVYFGYQNADGHPRVAVSRDRGLTWTDDQDVGAALGIKNVVFPTVVAGDGPRAAFAFLGTTTGGNYQDTANFTGVWHLYVAHTYDGGKSWVTANATAGDPVQRGSICTGGTTCGNDRNLLDFIDATVDRDGRVLVGYADGCIGACVQGGPNSFSAYASIARQSSGKPLFSKSRPFRKK